MFTEKQVFVAEFSDRNVCAELVKTERGYIGKIVIQLSFHRWDAGFYMNVRLVHVIYGERRNEALLVFEQDFYDAPGNGRLSLPPETHPMLTALACGEVHGQTAADMARTLFWEAVKCANFLKKYMPHMWLDYCARGIVKPEECVDLSTDVARHPYVLVQYLNT